MADEPISALTLFTSYSTADEVEILDVSDTTFAATGTNKRIQFSTLLSMAGLGIYSAQAYGATGNGTTDDTASIQAALNAAYAAGGGTVYLPTGNYLISSKLLLQTGVRLTGDGYGSTILANSIAVGFNDPVEGIDLHPTVEVPSNHYGTCMDHVRLLAIAGTTDARIYGWHGRPSSHDNWVHHCRFEGYNCTTGGASDPSNSSYNIIEANALLNCACGIYLTGTSNQYGNVVASNRMLGCQIGIDANSPWNTVITGNYVESSLYCLDLQSTYNSIGGVTISGNSFVATGTSGAAIILAAGCGATVISGNTLSQNSSTNSTSLVQLTGTTDILITGNILRPAASSPAPSRCWVPKPTPESSATTSQEGHTRFTSPTPG